MSLNKYPRSRRIIWFPRSRSDFFYCCQQRQKETPQKSEPVIIQISRIFQYVLYHFRYLGTWFTTDTSNMEISDAGKFQGLN